MVNLSLIYEQVQEKVNKIIFENLWPEFSKYDFALYNEATVILRGLPIQKTKEFIGNGAILYEGRYIAIWCLTEEMDIDILTSKIIHEMFHGYQYEMKDKRFANEFEAIRKYKYSPYYLQLKHNENLLLASLVLDFNSKKLSDFLTYRKLRQVNFSYEYNYETSIEAIEGAAQYVEIMVLKELSEEKYNERFKSLVEKICTMENLIPMRIMSYDTGALFLKLCIDNNLPIHREVGNVNEIYYSKLVEERPYKSLAIDVQPDIVNFYNEDMMELKNKIISIITSSTKVLKGNFELLGFNVYSARYFEGYVYSQGFLMYKDQREHILYGDYLFKMDNNLVKEIYTENKN